MAMSRKTTALTLVAPLAIGFVTPSLIILVMEITLGRRPILESVRDVLTRQFAEGHSLFLLAMTGLLPFVILAILLAVFARDTVLSPRLPALAAGGTIGALALMIPAHVAVWLPIYTDAVMSSTSVLAFLYIPFLVAVTMLIGLGIAGLLTRRRGASYA
jgi:hypothetical protein